MLQVNFIRIFRLGQLTAQYLLHVQDSLARDTVRLRVGAAPERCSRHRLQPRLQGSQPF